jgi:hypothetical protein
MRLGTANAFEAFAIMTVTNSVENFGDVPKFSSHGVRRPGEGTRAVEGGRRWGGLIWGSMEAGKASRSAMGSGLLRAAHVREDRPA